MRVLLVEFAVLGLALSITFNGHEYTPVPRGYMPTECVHNLPSGSRIVPDETHTVAYLPNGRTLKIPLCDSMNGTRPRFLKEGGDGYNGWLEYTASEASTSYDSFIGYFSVPDKPKDEPEVLYLFTGLQNINWIPKVDPDPSADFDIIQPVLQYPGEWGSYWSIRSWYVTLRAGALASDEIQVESGDTIFGNMTRVGDDDWYIGTSAMSSKKVTTLHPQNTRLRNQPWAYNTLECYGCHGCSTYPTKPCTFSKLQLTADNDPAPAEWKANPKPSKDRQCHESVQIVSDQEVVIKFQ